MKKVIAFLSIALLATGTLFSQESAPDSSKSPDTATSAAAIKDSSTAIDTGTYTIYRYDDVSNQYRISHQPKELEPPKTAQPPSQTQAAPPDATKPPQQTSSSRESADDAAYMAYSDARADVNGGTWFTIGCLLGCTGWLIAYMIEPNPPATRLLGKSPEYIAVYSDAYKKEAKKIQAQKALQGCLVGTLLTVMLQLMLSLSTSGY